MGQINSKNFQNLLPNIYSDIFNKEPNTLIAKEIQELAHDRFLEIISELNILSRDSLDKEGKVMVFAVKKESDLGILWKTVVEIACIKLDPDSRKVESYRLLTLEELLKVFFTLKCQREAIDESKSSGISYEEFVSSLSDDPDLSVQCSICFERKHELTLPCAHSFCSHCIEEWNSEHLTCPICRDKLKSTDDTWVLFEKPNVEEVNKELRLNLLELTEDKHSSSCNPS